MTQFKGTPGPWSVNTIGKHWNNPTLVHLEVTFGTDGECICDTVYRREDADLIAAAPELLELVIHVKNCVENDGTYEPANLDYFNKIINKATGETK